MNYEKIILELLDRIKTLEEKVAALESHTKEAGKTGTRNALASYQEQDGLSLVQKSKNYIMARKNAARSEGSATLVLLCNDIQKALGVTNRTPSVCQAMYDCMTDPRDKVLSAPPSGKSTTVLVEYYLK